MDLSLLPMRSDNWMDLSLLPMRSDKTEIHYPTRIVCVWDSGAKYRANTKIRESEKKEKRNFLFPCRKDI